MPDGAYGVLWCPGHYLNQCRFIVNRTPWNKLQWSLDQNIKTISEENTFQNIKWFTFCLSFNVLTECDLVTLYGCGSILDQVKACCLTTPSHYLNQCYVDLALMGFCCTNLGPISQEVLKLPIHWMSFANALVKLFPNRLSGANELTHHGLVMPYDNIDLGQHWLR